MTTETLTPSPLQAELETYAHQRGIRCFQGARGECDTCKLLPPTPKPRRTRILGGHADLDYETWRDEAGDFNGRDDMDRRFEAGQNQ